MLWCGNGEGLIRTSHPALEGSYCGQGMVSRIISSIENRRMGKRKDNTAFRCVAMESALRQRFPCLLLLGALASGTICLRRLLAEANVYLVR